VFERERVDLTRRRRGAEEHAEKASWRDKEGFTRWRWWRGWRVEAAENAEKAF